MNDLIRALTILAKYGNPRRPTHCEHDLLHVAIDPALVSEEDKQTLEGLGFVPGDGDWEGGFNSFRFGSC